MSRKRTGNGRFAALRAKSPVYWVAFVAWFSLVGYVAWLSFIHALANVTWQQNPDMALRFVPDHPLALSRKADELFAEKQDPATLARVEAMAKRSLRGGALNPVAIRLLGYVADVRGDQKKARELMLLSHKVSRRDFGTQLWLIEDAVARNDKKKALYHYDIAMRTTTSGHAILFPTLTGALTDPEVRQGVVPYIRRAPEWLLGFLTEAIGTSENPANVADILVKAGRLPDNEDYRNLSNSLLAQLAVKDKLPAFRQYYLSLPGTRSATLTSAALNSDTVNLRYSVAGWQFADNPAIGGSFSSTGTSGAQALTAFAGSGERGDMMRKILFLKPGQYRFRASYSALEASTDAEIRWDLQCLRGGVASGLWFKTDRVVKGPSVSSQTLTIPSDCPYQKLVLQLAGGSSQTGMEFTLHSVSLNQI
jgi:hypothetical protein